MAIHEEKLEKAQERAREAIEEGAQTTRRISSEINQVIKDNPWPYIAGAAFFSFLLGFIMKGSRKDS